jgi:hypothetical protein
MASVIGRGAGGYVRLRIVAIAVGDWEEVRRQAMGTDAAAGDGVSRDPACGSREGDGVIFCGTH